MRALTAKQTKVFSNPTGWAVYSRFSAKRAGVWIDLTNLAGYDWVQSWGYRQTVDDQAASLSLEISREVYNLSLAPLRTNTKLANGGPVIQANSEIKLEVACMPPGTSPASGDWVLFFHGYVDSIDSGPDPIRVECRDLTARLQKKFIKKQRPYSNSTGVAVETIMQSILDDNMAGDVYSTSAPYKLGDCVRATVSGTVYGFICITAGTSGASAPPWNTTTGQVTSDGSAQWQCTGPSVTLQVPASPLWVIKGPWYQDKKSVMDALTDLAGQTGWSLRYLYNTGLADFALTFYEPYRSKTTPDWTWSANQYHDVKQLKTDVSGVRNVVRVVYGDLGSPDNLGNPTRIGIVVLDGPSIAKYDENYIEITESATARINDSTQATNLANSVLSDLKDPYAEHQITLDFFWPVEIHDLWQFNANGIHYDANQKFSVVQIEHTVSQNEATTTVLTRGTSVANFMNWIERGAAPGIAPQARLQGPAAVTNVLVTPKIGGAAITFTPPTTVTSPDYKASELHLSTTNGFTPGPSTLTENSGLTNRFEVGHLTPGTTYYGQVLAKDSKGNVSATSGQFSFTAGYSRPADMQPLVDWLTLPPNGNFEAVNVGIADNWTGTTTGFSVLSSGAFSGSRALYTTATATGILKSGLFPIRAADTFHLRYMVKTTSGTSASSTGIGIHFYSDAGVTQVAANTWSQSLTATWTEWRQQITAPSNAVFAQVWIDATTTVADTLFDSVVFERLPVSYVVGSVVNGNTTAFQNGWGVYSTYTPRFVRDSEGFVTLEGGLASGTIGQVAFQLPPTFRPPTNRAFVVYSNGAYGAISVDSAGHVNPFLGSNVEIRLEGIRFFTG